MRKAMKLKGIKSSSVTDIVAALLAKGVDIFKGCDAHDARPPTSRFQSALAQRIAAANVMWGASDVVDFKVRVMMISPPVHSAPFCSRAATCVGWRYDARTSMCAML